MLLSDEAAFTIALTAVDRRPGRMPQSRTAQTDQEFACDAWRKLIAQPETITSITTREWARIGQR